MDEVTIIVGSASHQSKEVKGAQYSVSLFYTGEEGRGQSKKKKSRNMGERTGATK